MTPQPVGSLSRRYWDLGVLYLAVVVQAGLALWVGSRGWFSGDLLHYYVERGGLPGGSEGLMEPHAGHWQVTLILVYVLMFKLIGLTTYVPYVILAVLVHVALVLVMHRLLLRLGAGRLPALIAALALPVFGAGSSAQLAEAPLALTAPLLLGAISLLVLIRREHDLRSTVVASALLLVGVTISLVGVVAVVWVGVFALSRGKWHMVRLVALPVVAFIGWYVLWGQGSSGILGSWSEALQVPEDAGRLLVGAFGDVTGGWLAVSVFGLAVLVAVRRRGRERPLLVNATIAGVVGALLYAVVSVSSALSVGVGQTGIQLWRFVALVLLLPGLALVLDAWCAVLAAHMGERRRRASLALTGVALCLLGLLAGLGQYRWAQSASSPADLALTHLAGSVLATSTGEKMLTDAVPGSRIRGDDLSQLSDPALGSELPDLDLSDQARIEAESNYFVAVTNVQLELAPPAEVSSDGFDPGVTDRPGCHTYTATGDQSSLVLTSFIGTGFAFRGDATRVTTELSRPDYDLTSDPVDWPTSPDEWTYVATTAQVASLAVMFDSAGDYTFCFAV